MPSSSRRPRKKARSSFDTSYFDADINSAFGGSQRNSDSKDEDAPLSWRLDKSTSLSDWTVVIERNSGEKTAYHVHKCVLSVGPRKSEYFSALFKSSVKESATCTSNIKLEDSAADAFPVLLDYLYSLIGDDDVGITTDRAVALRFLAQYFVMRKLFRKVTEFIRENFELDRAPVYLQEAALFRDDKIVAAAVEVCAMNLIDIDTSLLLELSPDLFRQVVTSQKLKCDSNALSKLVSDFLEYHPEVVNYNLLTALTDSQIMPSVDPVAALPLLKLVVSCHGVEEVCACRDGVDSSLKKRCMGSLAASWRDHVAEPLQHTAKCEEGTMADGSDAMRFLHTVKEFPRALKSELLEASLFNAKNEVEQKDLELKTKSDQISRLVAENQCLRNSNGVLSFKCAITGITAT